jgi:hypothetical protein
MGGGSKKPAGINPGARLYIQEEKEKETLFQTPSRSIWGSAERIQLSKSIYANLVPTAEPL